MSFFSTIQAAITEVGSLITQTGNLALSVSPAGAAVLCTGVLLSLHPIRFREMRPGLPGHVMYRRMITSITRNQLILAGGALILGQALIQGAVPLGLATIVLFVGIQILGLNQTKHAITTFLVDKIESTRKGTAGHFERNPVDRVGLRLASVLPAGVLGWVVTDAIWVAFGS